MFTEKLDLKRVWGFVCKYKYIAAILFVGLILLLLPGGNTDDIADAVYAGVSFRTEDFEKRIESALLQCEGVGRARVILSVDSGPESVYAKEAKQTVREQESGVVTESDSDMKPSIMSEGSGRERPIVIKELYPEFRGALVICDGAEATSVRKCIIESVSALTGLSTERISVVKMKG